MAAEKKSNLQVFGRRPSSVKTRTVLHEWPLPRAYAASEWAKLELRALGHELTVSLDGQVLSKVHNNVVTGPDTAQVYATKADFFRGIVLTPLDKTPTITHEGEIIDLLPLVDMKRDTVNGVSDVTPEGNTSAHGFLTAKYSAGGAHSRRQTGS